MSGSVTGGPRILLRLEGLFVLLVATAAYAQLNGSWILYAALFLAPDLSLLGYFAGRKVGAAMYNLVHCYGLPLVCIGYGAFAHATAFTQAGLIWAAHIGIDRALGYGLKYFDGFGRTHLSGQAKDRQMFLGEAD